MRKRTGLTLVEILVLIGVIAVLTVIIIERLRDMNTGRRAVCLGNLKNLSLAWLMYADDNDGKLVNGIAGGDPDPDGDGKLEIPWVQAGDSNKDKYQQEKAIKLGALWPYTRNTKFYRCPRGEAGHIRTYSIVDSMFGEGWGTNDPNYWIKNLSSIPRPHRRVVFVCEGRTENGSYRIDFSNPSWEDPPLVRHYDGATLIYADCHTEYWKWQAKETVQVGKNRLTDFHPKTAEGIQDLAKMQRAVWGELGYKPK